MPVWIIKKPTFWSYFSTKRMTSTQTSEIPSQERGWNPFLNFTCFWIINISIPSNVCQNCSKLPYNSPLNGNFLDFCLPSLDLSIDEFLTLWKGLVIQTITSKTRQLCRLVVRFQSWNGMTRKYELWFLCIIMTKLKRSQNEERK